MSKPSPTTPIARKLRLLAPGIWDVVVNAMLAELKKQWKDLAAFWKIAKKLGASTDMTTEAGWKLVLADLQWVALRGTPSETNVAPFLRKKKLIQ